MDIKDCGGNSVVESQSSKLLVAGSIPAHRSKFRETLELVFAIAACNWMALIAGFVLFVYYAVSN